MINKAFILGAGLGTRLRPLTETTPKPLIPVFQKPLITFALDHLIAAGVSSFVINTHRLAEQFDEQFGAGEYCGRSVTLVHEPELLESGGGIKNAERWLGDAPFITYSGDVLTDADLQTLIEEHFRAGNDVTLGLRQTALASDVAIEAGRVLDIANRYGIPGNYDFANVAVWNSEIFQRLPPEKKISFIPVLAEWIGAGGKIGGTVLDDGRWFNVGSAADYLRVHEAILAEPWKPSFVRESDWPKPVHESAEIATDAKLLGCTSIGPNCRVGSGVILQDSILWTGAQIASRSRLSRCIVRSHQTATGEHENAVL